MPPDIRFKGATGIKFKKVSYHFTRILFIKDSPFCTRFLKTSCFISKHNIKESTKNSFVTYFNFYKII